MAVKTILAAVDTGRYDIEYSLAELSELVKAADMEPLGSVVQKRDAPDSKFCMGEGKLAEVKRLAEETGAEICVFDCELSGSQTRNISDFLEMEVIDRTMLILQIFSGRALSREGKIQTELALLQYQLPRIGGMGTVLSRQGGGGGGGGGARRGGGETKSEYDRRYIQQRISFLKEKLAKTEGRRQTASSARRRRGLPVIALAGYTNVGKSSLLNILTGSDILRQDMLFATLDPTARKLLLPDGQTGILIDTVGFVSRLPHNLVDAFKSTLEQAKYADVILNVTDASSKEGQMQLEISRQTLIDIGCDSENIITVFNKCDLPHRGFIPEGAVKVSAKTGYGLDNLLNAVCEKLAHRIAPFDIVLPYDQYKLVNTIKEYGTIDYEEYTDAGIALKGKVDRRLLYLLTSYGADK